MRTKTRMGGGDVIFMESYYNPIRQYSRFSVNNNSVFTTSKANSLFLILRLNRKAG